jgi:dienelactone hydrolase
MTDGPSRRRVLEAVGASTLVALAGCQTDSTERRTTTTPPPTTTPSTRTTTPPPTTTAVPTTTTAAPPPTPPTTTEPGEGAAARERAARTFLDRLASGAFEAAAGQFSPDAGVRAETLASLWTSLQRSAGAFVGVEGYQQTTVSGFEAVVVRARFAGGLQGIRLVFDDRTQLVGLQFVPVTEREWEPPEYVDSAAFTTTEVAVDGPGDCTLPGEVTVPAAEGGAGPNFVLLGGSGPTDRNGTLGPNEPYRDLAYGVASAGRAASLRYDKRTAACRVDPASLTLDDEYTDDALRAVERLRAVEGTDPARTVVAGHSLGAYLAPRVARRVDDAAGLLLLAPPGEPVHRLVVEQTRYLAALDGAVSAAEQDRIDEVAAAAERVEALDIEAGETVLGAGRPYWEQLLAYDPVEATLAADVPVFVAFGGRDYQVDADDREVWTEGLAGVERATVRTYEDLNHLFAPGSGPGRPSEYAEANHVAARVVDDVGAWIAAR